MPIVTLGLLLECTGNRKIPFDKAWLNISPNSAMQINELDDEWFAVPAKCRIGGPCANILFTELFDFARKRFGFRINLHEVQIAPSVRRTSNNEIQTSIRIIYRNISFIVTPQMFETQQGEVVA